MFASVLLLLGTLLPLFFGGVHDLTYSIAHSVVFFTLAVFFASQWLVENRSRARSHFLTGQSSWYIMGIISAFILYLGAQTVFLSLFVTEHPVLGQVSATVQRSLVFSNLLHVFFFISVFAISRLWLNSSESRQRLFNSAIILVGLGVSLIALSHWFYDNGKLFWTFAPETVFTTERARWPFVNSNHLAHFLLPVFSICLAAIVHHIDSVRLVSNSIAHDRRGSLADILTSRRVQRNSVLCISILCVLGSSGLAILASLSRGSWMGLACAIALMSVLFMRIAPLEISGGQRAVPENLVSLEDERKRRKKIRRNEGMSSRNRTFDARNIASLLGALGIRFIRPLLILGAVVLVVGFFSGRGGDLVSERLEYGLLYAKDDMRWQLYKDSLPILFSYPLFGIGFGSWETVYSRVMDNSLAGMDPVYLHSDPFQLLLETGIVGTLPWIFLAGFVLYGSFATVGKIPRPRALVLIGATSGLFGLALASFLDFPFHIPALQMLSAMLLALWSASIDGSLKTPAAE